MKRVDLIKVVRTRLRACETWREARLVHEPRVEDVAACPATQRNQRAIGEAYHTQAGRIVPVSVCAKVEGEVTRMHAIINFRSPMYFP